MKTTLFDEVVQVSSRIWVLWGLIWQAPEASSTGGFALGKAGPQLGMYTLFFAWGVTEVLRYGFFAVKVTSHGLVFFLLSHALAIVQKMIALLMYTFSAYIMLTRREGISFSMLTQSANV